MVEEMKFEKAMEKLEKIVQDLETGNISLDEAIKKYEEGVQLAGQCQRKLLQAEKKIEVLTKTLDGSLKAVPMEEEGLETTEAKPKRPAKKSKTKSTEEPDEDLLI